MTALIGRWGRMVEVAESGPYPVSTSRPDTIQTSLYGHRYVTPGRVARRRWEWPMGVIDDADAALLEQLVHDSRRGPLWWYDPTAPSSNMILAAEADPVPSRTLSAVAAAVVDGRTWDMVSGVQSSQVPTVAGVGYRVDVRASAASTVTVETLDSDAAVVATAGLVPGTGVLSVVWTADTEAGVKVTVDGDGWSGVQMVDVAGDPAGWRPGRGCPKVHLSGLDQRLLWALTAGEVRWRDMSVQLSEVDG